MVRPGSGRFEVGFWVGFRVGLRARDFPPERVLSRTPLIIRTVDQKCHLVTSFCNITLQSWIAIAERAGKETDLDLIHGSNN